MDPSDPLVPVELIIVAKGLGLGREEMEIQFERAMKADPSEFKAYKQKLIYLMPKWHGSKEEMFAFARSTFNAAPPHSAAPRILAIAHWEMYDRSKDESYFKDPEVWKEVKASYGKVFECFPESNETRNWLARSAYLAGDYETAAREFEAIGNDWLPQCWVTEGYFGDTKKLVFDHLEEF